MRPESKPTGNSLIPKCPSTLQKKKDRIESIKAAREKYSKLSTANLPKKNPTIPVAPTSGIPRPSIAFRSEASSLSEITNGSRQAQQRVGRVPTGPTIPRPSLSSIPHSTAQYASRPSTKPTPVPRQSLVGGPSTSSGFVTVSSSLDRIMNNEQLPMASGARPSSIYRRQEQRPSLLPMGINIFLANDHDRLIAEQHMNRHTPSRTRSNSLMSDSVKSSRVRFHVESIQEQRESAGDDLVTATESSSSMPPPSLPLSTSYQPLRRETTSLFGIPMKNENNNPLNEPPRSILKQRQKRIVSVREELSSSPQPSTSSTLSSSTNTIVSNSNHSITSQFASSHSNLPSTPLTNNPVTRVSSSRKTVAPTVFSIYSDILKISDEEWKKGTVEMIDAIIEKMNEKRNEVLEDLDEETLNEVVEEDTVDTTLPLPKLNDTIYSRTPRRRSQRLASTIGCARSLYRD